MVRAGQLCIRQTPSTGTVGRVTLPRLHRVLQASMGWTNAHLHEFIINGVRYSTPDPDWSDELRQKDERGVALRNALGGESRCFDYVYDFGDDWHHVLMLEDRHATAGRKKGYSVRCRRKCVSTGRRWWPAWLRGFCGCHHSSKTQAALGVFDLGRRAFRSSAFRSRIRSARVGEDEELITTQAFFRRSGSSGTCVASLSQLPSTTRVVKNPTAGRGPPSGTTSVASPLPPPNRRPLLEA